MSYRTPAKNAPRDEGLKNDSSATHLDAFKFWTGLMHFFNSFLMIVNTSITINYIS